MAKSTDVARMEPAGASDTRKQAKEALLDAAERLLVRQGYSGITTRKLAKEAGLNHGLVHYYFGSMDEVMVQALERFTRDLVQRQREMYAQDVPFIEKWRTAWGYQEDDIEAGYTKIFMELQALAWNHPETRERLQRVVSEWRAVLTEAFTAAVRDYGIEDEFPPEAVVALVMTMAQGFMLERLADNQAGHQALLQWIDSFLEGLEKRRLERLSGDGI